MFSECNTKTQMQVLDKIRKQLGLTQQQWKPICKYLQPDDYDLTDEDHAKDFMASAKDVKSLIEDCSSIALDRGSERPRFYVQPTIRALVLSMVYSGFVFARDMEKALGKQNIISRITWDNMSAEFNSRFSSTFGQETGNTFRKKLSRGRKILKSISSEERLPILRKFFDMPIMRRNICNGVSWICPARKHDTLGRPWCAFKETMLEPSSGCIVLNTLLSSSDK